MIKTRKMESGVALISVLLLVVIVTVLSVSMIQNQNFATHQIRNSYDFTQTNLYALGGEELARQILWQDFQDSPGIDHLNEEWAEKNLYFEFEGGEITINIIDLQGKFNINSLILEGDLGREARRRFGKLLLDNGLDVMYLDRLIDWMDYDGVARTLGAEDYDYLGLATPYRTSGQPFTDVTELSLILGMDFASFEQLRNSLSALPELNTPLNINTSDLTVLNAILPASSGGVDNSLLRVQETNGPFNSVDEFLQASPISPLGIKATGLSVQSNFFEVQVRARYGDRFGYLTSIIQRGNDGSTHVISRNHSRKIFPMKDSAVQKAKS
ncbi:MAG: general secretion pathway protein GspK [Gammaproteobacteria bacterium TMED1]|jgi:general secretion pathway protein K|nr:MAG: general secretion pathway protein GspK [Gammaproteobacteria bacterium TMED1]|tara:strand:- start:6579 stop:7559 length:981 start_codon:yes stop_codon:yes gene_type:complete